MSHQRQFRMMGGGSHPEQYNDTTYTKIYVGGLAWETQSDSMGRYFEQFGDILEAVVITYRNGRSKGYGFVTFRDPEAAMRACQNPSPVIDGRRTNCNIASLGPQKTRPPTPRHGVRRFRSAHGAHHGSSSSTNIQQQTGQYLIPYSAYRYAGYSQDIIYPMNYYNLYGGQQFSPYYPTGASLTPRMSQNVYQFDPQMVQQYHYLPQQLGLTVIIQPSFSMPMTASTTTPAALGDYNDGDSYNDNRSVNNGNNNINNNY